MHGTNKFAHNWRSVLYGEISYIRYDHWLRKKIVLKFIKVKVKARSIWQLHIKPYGHLAVISKLVFKIVTIEHSVPLGASNLCPAYLKGNEVKWLMSQASRPLLVSSLLTRYPIYLVLCQTKLSQVNDYTYF